LVAVRLSRNNVEFGHSIAAVKEFSDALFVNAAVEDISPFRDICDFVL
jgi:hypothetical protein